MFDSNCKKKINTVPGNLQRQPGSLSVNCVYYIYIKQSRNNACILQWT